MRVHASRRWPATSASPQAGPANLPAASNPMHEPDPFRLKMTYGPVRRGNPGRPGDRGFAYRVAEARRVEARARSVARVFLVYQRRPAQTVRQAHPRGPQTRRRAQPATVSTGLPTLAAP